MSEIAAIVSSIGFPIVACIILAKHYAKREDKNENNLEKMRETIDNNTRVINDLQISYNNNNAILREIVTILQKLKGGD